MLNLKSQNYNSNQKSKDVKIRAYDFSLEIIKFCSTFPQKRVFWVIEDQLIRSVTSIGANMIEGQAGSSRKDFIKYYEIALKSANESKYWISLLKDSFLNLKPESENLLSELDEICRMLGSSVLTLKGKRFKF